MNQHSTQTAAPQHLGGGGALKSSSEVLRQLADSMDLLARSAEKELAFQLLTWAVAIRRQCQAADQATAEVLHQAAG